MPDQSALSTPGRGQDSLHNMEEKNNVSREEIFTVHPALEKILRDKINHAITQIEALEKPGSSPSFFFRTSKSTVLQQFHETKRIDLLSILQESYQMALGDLCNKLNFFVGELRNASVDCYNCYQEPLYKHADYLHVCLSNCLEIPHGPWLDNSDALTEYCTGFSTNDSARYGIFQRLAEGGYAPAAHQRALYYHQSLKNFRCSLAGISPSKADEAEAAKRDWERRQRMEQERANWTHKAATQGYPPAQLMLACHLEKNSIQAHALLNQLVEQNYAPAQYYLAVCYEKGWLALAPDRDKALQLYELASQNGHMPAQNKLKGYTNLKQELSKLSVFGFFTPVLEPIIAEYVGYQDAELADQSSCVLS